MGLTAAAPMQVYALKIEGSSWGNLILNAVEAMSDASKGSRDLLISQRRALRQSTSLIDRPVHPSVRIREQAYP
jgi:hypothetical protein